MCSSDLGRLKCLALDSTIGGLKTGPCYFRGRAGEQLKWFPYGHLEREYSTFALPALIIEMLHCQRQ